MKIIFFTHPQFLNSQSMNRYAEMLAKGMSDRGHIVEVVSPKDVFFSISSSQSINKWLGYIDQYITFPIQIRKQLDRYDPSTLFVFTDHALGPWVPMVARRKHIIHCHDFLAQQSAMGEIIENPTSLTGKFYQSFIRNGYRKGKNFVSISHKTRLDLHRFLGLTPEVSEVIYNGLSNDFKPQNVEEVRCFIKTETKIDVSEGYVMHIGGNQWYKNRLGVVDIYNQWRVEYNNNLPLIMIGTKPDRKLMEAHLASQFSNDIYFLDQKDDNFIQQAYSGASVLLFPSFDEGFGWPIAEAMASGCPVITTGIAPMTEVGGDAAFYIPRRSDDKGNNWSKAAAKVLNDVINLAGEDKSIVIRKGLINAGRFDLKIALDQIEALYLRVIQN